jgi:predicted nucleic acid-binding protein
MLFLYWMEEHPDYAMRVGELHEQMARRRDRLCTSVFTVGEILTGFHKRGAVEAATKVLDAMRPPLVELIPFTIQTADRFAQIRARHRVSPADAIHLASAAQMGANLFLTNDRRLSKLVIEGIDFVAGLDTNLFQQ